MSTVAQIGQPRYTFPRYFRIAGRWINSYQVMLCVGLYAGVLASAAAGQSAGISPLRVGVVSVVGALAALPGARVYHLLVYARFYSRKDARKRIWDGPSGGWSLFGGLLPAVLASFLLARGMGIPAVALWDYMSAGVLAGGFWVRMGCAFNGCCVGRETTRWYGIRLHDTTGTVLRRIPVQFIEMGWWLLGAILFLALWPRAYPPGTYALGVVAWYGFARFWLEPLRARPDVVFGRVRINQVVAAILLIVAVAGIALLVWPT